MVFRFFSFLAAVAATWTRHPGINCYAGNGGTPVDPRDIPLQEKTVASCQAACESTANCVAIVREVDGQQTSNCWLRSSVQLSQCQASTGVYDTYTFSSTPARRGSFFVLGDWGYDSAVHGNIKPGCQAAIANAMKAKQEELGDVKFVLNVGDSFYPAGTGFPSSDSQWKTKWLDVYGQKLTDLPWFSVYGNHDYQSQDQCACSADKKGCSQLNANVSGFTMPDLNYFDDRFLSELNVEVVALDMNAVDYLDGNYFCATSGCESTCTTLLNNRRDEGFALFAKRNQASTAKNLLVFSHYPTDYLKRANYTALVAGLKDNSKHNITYFGGHRHNVDQSSMQEPLAPNVNWLVGGGGGWGCDGWSDQGHVEQGFVVGEVNHDFTINTYSVLVPADVCC